MKKLGLTATFIALAMSNAFAADQAIQCEIIETPTSTNDSWAITILNGRAAFFDNDQFNYAALVKTTETGGGSTYQSYQSIDNGDPFRINLEDPEGLYGKYSHNVIYAELFLAGKQRPEIFECKKTTVENVKWVFED